jgi:hypothetical protein
VFSDEKKQACTTSVRDFGYQFQNPEAFAEINFGDERGDGTWNDRHGVQNEISNQSYPRLCESRPLPIATTQEL